MKAILISVRPEWVAKILNGEKTIEIRKRFPKDYVGWVYIYVTKDNKNCLFDFREDEYAPDKFGYSKADKWYRQHYKLLNGKVVARFWCDKVEEINYLPYEQTYYTQTLDTVIWKGHEPTLLKVCCLSWEELDNYLKEKKGYAIHITKLEIFDKPKEISEFEIRATEGDVKFNNIKGKMLAYKPLSRAPQSWCYIEI